MSLTPIALPAARAARLAERLLRWYAHHRRTMPWRDHPDPYAVWVSEIMLQQTRVDTVDAYFRRFYHAFPTVDALAAASIDDVLKQWQGLGYYSRARNLQKAAKQLVADHDSQLPADVDALLALPGIGRYTAGAIASMAFGQREPVVDGNVIRVLSRLFAIHDDPKRAAVGKQLWALAGALVPAAAPGDFNQALMDLGSTVCTPRNPTCGACPWTRFCQGRKTGAQNELPFSQPSKPLPHHTIVVGVIHRGRGQRERVLIDQRQPDQMLGGMWEFPGGKVEPGETHAGALAREVREEVGLVVTVGDHFATVNHAFSHFKITLHAYHCRVKSGTARAIECAKVQWVTRDELHLYALPKATLKVIEAWVVE